MNKLFDHRTTETEETFDPEYATIGPPDIITYTDESGLEQTHQVVLGDPQCHRVFVAGQGLVEEDDGEIIPVLYRAITHVIRRRERQ